MKVLTLNCQKEYGSGVAEFINQILKEGEYDFLLLQEAVPLVLGHFNHGEFSYNLARVTNDAIGDWSQLCILYRDTIELREYAFFPFVELSRRNIHRREFGLLLGRFQIKGKEMIVGTLHVNAGPQPRLRKKELKFVKRSILKFNRDNLPVIFGGDFNSGLPWENRRNREIFAPEFLNPTYDSGPTCDSRYVEPVVFLNSLARFLAKFGIYVLLKVDHIFVDQGTALSQDIRCRVLPARVSDHSPLEIALT